MGFADETQKGIDANDYQDVDGATLLRPEAHEDVLGGEYEV